MSQSDRVWSYADLAWATRQVTPLVTDHSPPGAVIAVGGHRCPELIAALLAVLATNRVLLTLDPQLPHERRQMMLQQAGAQTLLTLEAAAAEVMPGEPVAPGHPRMTVLAIPRMEPPPRRVGTPREPSLTAPAEHPPKSDDAAYMFFTSGSTATPKGVLGVHHGLSHFLRWQAGTFAVGPGDRSAQLTGLSFDVVLRDILLPLVSGATLCLPKADVLPPDEVVPWLARERITLLHAVPTVAQAWALNATAPANPAPLRAVFFAGEALGGALVERWRSLFPGLRDVINLYGTTEATLAQCWYRVPRPAPPGIQPVGGPLPDTQAFVLTPDRRQCDIGKPGEITIRTPFRTLGYLGDPAETNRRFVPNPLRADPTDLLVLTGDVGRVRADGLLEVLGRVDNQVKIRGVQVRPEHVAGLLEDHPAVAAAAVLPVADGNVVSALRAYVVVSTAYPPDEQAPERMLRAYLADRLPPAAVPAEIVLLDRMPLTSNGKLDQVALMTASSSSNIPAPPRTTVQRQVAEIWAEVLSRTPGSEDDFFVLGGHSLHAAAMLARVADRFAVQLPLRALFQHPVLKDFAELVERAATAE